MGIIRGTAGQVSAIGSTNTAKNTYAAIRGTKGNVSVVGSTNTTRATYAIIQGTPSAHPVPA